MITLTIDGAEIQARDGATILDAADAAGIYIPRLCHHPALPAVDPEELEPWEEVFQGRDSRRHLTATSPTERPRGNGGYEGCLLCLVMVDGQVEPARACATRVAEGMRVTTSDGEIESRRRAKLRALFSSHPHACVQCAQRAGCALEPCSTNVAPEERCCPIFHNCELRKVAEHVGIPDDTPRYQPARLACVADEPLYLRDHNLCIGCLRCVRMCRDVRKVDALGFVLGEDGAPVVGTKAPTLMESGCRFCSSCVEVCPTGALRLTFEDPRLDGDRATRCVADCPAGMDVPRYLREIRRGAFARAEAVIREAAPLPQVLGQVCFHPCEDYCLRGELSEPVAICALKRAALDHAGAAIWKSRLQQGPATGKRVAVIGAGPAGLTAAWFLRLKGHEVVLIDSQHLPGGWLRDGIPRYRLSRDALDADVREIVELGVELKMGVEVGKDLGFESVREAHDAVFVAAGARRARQLSCDGAERPEVESGLELLKRLAVEGDADHPRFSGGKVVVIGGGDVAIDVARTALRLGPDEVHLYCLEGRGEMPAHGREVAEAEREGVVVHNGWGPALIAGAVELERVDFHKCVSLFDDQGNFAPELDATVQISQAADRVLVAIGQEPALGFLASVERIELTGAGNIEVNAGSMATSIEGVFAGGDVVSGPASVVEAIAHGRRAASGIDRYLGGDGDIYLPLLDETEPDTELGLVDGFSDLERAPISRLSAAEAIRSFTILEMGYAPGDAEREADRCLRCDLRLLIPPALAPPEPWLELTSENVAGVPASEGVYQLLDEDKIVYAIKGVDDLRSALSQIVATSTKAKFFLFDQDPMYSKRESELIQEYLRAHGCMPPGEGEDDLDDLF
ncbi:MAG: FAD-dependent oxidoreductase [Gemmatimonadota bacterium]|nr:MAG: FAD-dependent oxidoreductase [Gemmatimonadota bacterium]